MTPKDARAERVEREMAAGAVLVERHRRLDMLERWIKAGKIEMFNEDKRNIVLKGLPKTGKVRVWIGDTLVAETLTGPHYPTEAFVAQVGLAIQALVGFAGVRPSDFDPPPQPKSPVAKHVAETQRRIWEPGYHGQD